MQTTITPPPTAVGLDDLIDIDLTGLGTGAAASTKLQCADKQASTLAARIRERDGQLTALAAALETDKADLKAIVSPLFFTSSQGKSAVETTVEIHILDQDGQRTGALPVQVQFQNRYSVGGKESKLSAAEQKALLSRFVPADVLKRYFGSAFTIKIKSENLPAKPADLQAFVNGLKELGARFNCGSAFEIKQVFAPSKEFHIARHTVLTPEQNLALNDDAACPIVAVVKANGTGRTKK